MSGGHSSMHDDYVCDAVYDYYGRRFATCSSDHTIRVWDQNENGQWTITARIPAHKSSIAKISWSFPEFGQLIASCSNDCSVKIWEEQAGAAVEDAQYKTSWACRAILKESRLSVNDLEFAPRHLGLKLATASSDGMVRIYEAVDVMNLSHFPMQDAFEAERTGVSCLSWCKSRFDPPTLVVGGRDVKVWQYDDSTRKWEVVISLDTQGDSVHDVSWAPKMGRSYHLVATGGKDDKLKIYTLRQDQGTSSSSGSRYTASVKEIEVNSEVWRLDWNVTGTLLASSGEDGVVKLWRKTHEVSDVEY